MYSVAQRIHVSTVLERTPLPLPLPQVLAHVLEWTVPTVLRDWVYQFVGRHRLRWFGSTDACRRPTPRERRAFLDDDITFTPPTSA